MEIALCARCYRVRRRGATRQPDEGCPEMLRLSPSTGARGTAIAYTASLLYVYV